MLYFLKDKKDCTGCTACINVCPVKCISMQEDEEGFLYPVADERCTVCRQCEFTCPINTRKTYNEPEVTQHSVAAITRDSRIWEESSSGGAFSEICNAFGDSETIVFGAAFDGLKVIHKYVIGVENIAPFRKSKYVQSNLGDSLAKVEVFLKQGKKVIFSGLPCQIAGLRSLLRKSYENLLCIDLICHGVGSPRVFADCLKKSEKRFGSKIKNYTFRAKRIRMGNFKLYVSKYELEDGRVFFIEKDNYNKLFLNQLCLRKSCGENCKFRTAGRFGDLTIADFKNRVGVFPNLKDFRNYSTIIVNSKKGDSVFQELAKKMDVYQCSIDQVKMNNPLFFRQTEGNKSRDSFFSDYSRGNDLDELVIRFVQMTPSKKNSLKELLPYNAKFFLRKLLTKSKEFFKKSSRRRP